MIITIDGYCCQGKSTIGKKLAEALGWEFLSIGKVFRFVAVTFAIWKHDDQMAESTQLQMAIDIMRKTDMSLILSHGSTTNPTIEQVLERITTYPMLHEAVAEKIKDYAKERQIILDGRVGWQLFPHAFRNYFFVTSPEKRATFAMASRGLCYEEALKYIQFRDGFEIKYDYPDYVHFISLDTFQTVADIVAYVKADIEA